MLSTQLHLNVVIDCLGVGADWRRQVSQSGIHAEALTLLGAVPRPLLA